MMADPAEPSQSFDTSDPASALQALDAVVTALGGQVRQGQEGMARAVDRALASGEHALIQAGTGTGKSIGYLAPAAVHAVSSDQAVVVATATYQKPAVPAVAAVAAASPARLSAAGREDQLKDPAEQRVA